MTCEGESRKGEWGRLGWRVNRDKMINLGGLGGSAALPHFTRGSVDLFESSLLSTPHVSSETWDAPGRRAPIFGDFNCAGPGCSAVGAEHARPRGGGGAGG